MRERMQNSQNLVEVVVTVVNLLFYSDIEVGVRKLVHLSHIKNIQSLESVYKVTQTPTF